MIRICGWFPARWRAWAHLPKDDLRSRVLIRASVGALVDLRHVRHRTKVTKGPGSRSAGLAMAFKLIESAQTRWRAVNAPALARAGTRFDNGHLVERPDEAVAS